VLNQAAGELAQNGDNLMLLACWGGAGAPATVAGAPSFCSAMDVAQYEADAVTNAIADPASKGKANT
jgi:hypothetical protein